MHGHERLAHADFSRRLKRHQDGAALAGDVNQVAVFEQAARHVLRIHLDGRLGHMAKQAAQRTGAAHAVPLVTQPAGGQRKRVARFARLSQWLVKSVGEFGFAIWRGEDAVFVEADFAGGCALRVRPLLGALAFQQGVAQAGDVKVAAPGGFAVFVPDLLWGLVGEEGLACGQGNRGWRLSGGGQRNWGQSRISRDLVRSLGIGCPEFGSDPNCFLDADCFLQPVRKVHGNGPVVPGFTGRGNCGADAADAAFAVGHRAVLLAPGGRWQQQVGKGAGGGGGEGFLHDDQLGALQGAAHGSLVGHALGGVGAGNPQRLDFAIGSGLKHLYRRFSGLVWHRAPQLVQTP